MLVGVVWQEFLAAFAKLYRKRLWSLGYNLRAIEDLVMPLVGQRSFVEKSGRAIP